VTNIQLKSQGSKTCKSCKELKEIGEFHKDASRGDGLRKSCKSCRREDHLRTKNNYGRLYKASNGLCGICGTDACGTGNRMAVDHSHETGKVRSLLCNNCNTGLGSFKDDIISLAQAIQYLKKHE
tara:strand:+ start:1211 stop:1585 length:375 start_codon:yes stop_codon:yes gene_type:complete